MVGVFSLSLFYGVNCSQLDSGSPNPATCCGPNKHGQRASKIVKSCVNASPIRGSYGREEPAEPA